MRWTFLLLVWLCCAMSTLNAEEADSPEEAGAVEAALLPALKDKVAREGDRLRLSYSSGGSRVFLNQTACTSYKDCVFYFLKAYYPEQGYFLLDVFRYEGGMYWLVREKDGKEQEVRGEPVMSPDGKLFVSACFNDINCNALEIFRFTEQGIWREFAHAPQDASVYKVLRWERADKVALERITYQERKELRVPVTLVFQSGHWVLQEP